MSKKNVLKRALSGVLAASVLVSSLTLTTMAESSNSSELPFTKVSNGRVSATLPGREEYTGPAENEVTYADDDLVRVSIVLEGNSTIERYDLDEIAVSDAAISYREQLKAKQDTMAKRIEETTGEPLEVVWNITLAGNLISANVEYGQIEEIKKLSGVKDVVIETRYEAMNIDEDIPTDPNMSTSSAQIGSTAAWAVGYTGAGSRVAVIDTGIDYQHISFDGDALMYSLEQLAEKEGVDAAKYIEGLDLLDKEEIAKVFSQLNVSIRDGQTDSEKAYISEKIPFAYNYVDKNYVIDHEHDAGGEHGSHVEGIAAANAYVPDGEGGFVNALEEVLVQGVAPDAQILTMKVFGAGGGAYDSDYMVAIEDAIILGADSINLSLGSGNPGMSKEAGYEYQSILDGLAEKGAVVSISAGNSGYWAESSYNATGTLYLDDVSMQTDGSPGSYTNAFTVASVDNVGVTGEYIKATDGTVIFYNESAGDLSSLAGTKEYILIDGYGTVEDWEALGNLAKDKIAICSRGGGVNFTDKGNRAIEAGAIAAIVYNNAPGTINMSADGYNYTAPYLSITQADGAVLKATAEEMATADGYKYYAGSMEIGAGVTANPGDKDACYTMSDFSSWGVPGSLELKPEITAPGGNIYSVFGSVGSDPSKNHDAYENMSGTSMAAPQVAGLSALAAQYVRENGLAEKTGLLPRTLIQSLLMSTAEPVIGADAEGNPAYYYPVIQQGAGLANIENVINADTYILMGEDATKSYKDGKVKAELGDDPERTGEYTFSFTLNNLTDSAKTYNLYADLFTQAPFVYYANVAAANQDDQTQLTYYMDTSTMLLASEATFSTGDKVTVPASGSVKVTVTLKIADEDKAFLDEYYTNGAYVEGYVYAEPEAEADGSVGVVHSIPVLGYYGNWSDPSMFDKGSLIEYYYGLENRDQYLPNAIQGVPASNYFTMQYADGTYYCLGNPYFDDEYYDENRNAINSENGDAIANVSFGAIRNAAASRFTVYDETTGQFLVNNDLGAVSSAFYYANQAAWMQTQYTISPDFAPKGAADGDKLICTLTLAPEYYVDGENVNWDALGKGASFSMPFTVDNTAPEIIKAEYDPEANTITVTAKDNQYIAAIQVTNKAGNVTLGADGANMSVKAGEEVEYTFELKDNKFPAVLVQVYDYAKNTSTYAVGDINVETPDMIAVNVDAEKLITLDSQGNMTNYAPNDQNIISGTNIDHIVYVATEDGFLYTAPDSDVTDVTVVNYLGIIVHDMASNGRNLYGVTSTKDDVAYIYDIDRMTGEPGEKLFLQMPYNTNTLACDDEGNFYFNKLGTGEVYTFTLCGDVTVYDFDGDGDLDEDDGQALLDYRTGKRSVIYNIENADLDKDEDVDTHDAYEFFEMLKNGTIDAEDIIIDEESVKKVCTVSEAGVSEFLQSMEYNFNTDKLCWASCSQENSYYCEIDVKAGTYSNLVDLVYEISALIIPLDGDYALPAWAEPTDEITGVISIEETLGETVEILKGNTHQITAFVLPWTATDKGIVYQSSDEKVATVDANGVVTGVGKGECEIHAISSADSTKETVIPVSVGVIEKTVEGALQDADGLSEMFSWDLASDTGWEAGARIGGDGKTSITSITQRADGKLYVMDSVEDVYNMHIVDPTTGEVLETAASAGIPLWDMAYSNLFSTDGAPLISGIYNYYVFFNKDPMNLDLYVGDFSKYLAMSGAGYLVAIANTGIQGEDDYGAYEVYMLLDNAGFVWMVNVYAQGYMVVNVFGTDLEVSFDGYGANIYCSMVMDESGVLYLSQFDGITNNLYMLELDASGEMFSATYLGNVGKNIWPAAIYSVTDNAPSAQAAIANGISLLSLEDDDTILDTDISGMIRDYEGDNFHGEFQLIDTEITLEQAPVMVPDEEVSETEEAVVPETEETTAPEVEETTAPEVEETTAPEAEETTAPEAEETTAPEAEETTAPETEETTAPEAEETTAPTDVQYKGVSGSLNSVPVTRETTVSGDTIDVNVSLKNQNGAEVNAENGLMVVSYDPDVLTIKAEDVSAEHSSINVNEAAGTVVVAYVYPEEGKAEAELIFEVKDRDNVSTDSVTAHYVEYAEENKFAEELTNESVNNIAEDKVEGIFSEDLVPLTEVNIPVITPTPPAPPVTPGLDPDEGIVPEKPTDAVTPGMVDEVVENPGDDGQPVIYVVDDNAKLTSEVLEEIKESGKPIVLQTESGVTVTIDPANIPDEVVSSGFDFTVLVQYVSEAGKDEGVEVSDNALVIEPKQSGEYGFSYTVTVPADKIKFDVNSAKLYVIAEDGSVQEITDGFTVNVDGSVTINFTGYKKFYLAESMKKAETPIQGDTGTTPPTPEEPATQNPSDDGKGENPGTGVMLCVMPAVLAATAALAARKRKK